MIIVGITEEIIKMTKENNGIMVVAAGFSEQQYFPGDYKQKWQRRERYFVYESNEIKGYIRILDNI